LNHKRDEEILEELEIQPVDRKLNRYKSNWLQHFYKNEQQKDAQTRPNGRRQLGRPFTRLLDEAETDISRPDS
jgi:hypothetical protein